MEFKVTEYFSDTKETIERKPTKQELTAFEKREAKYEALELAKQERAAQRAQLLERLGLTEEEASLLLR
jgi:uncharacterized protein YdaU (DUF1376 family)